MTVYSYAQLEQLWINNGGSKATAPIAAAIAMAESSGRSDATSANPDGGTNVGPWQLDTPGGVGAGYSVAQLEDPNTNARIAVKGSANGTNWSDWETYATGAYKQYLSGSTTPDPNVPAATLDSAAGKSDCLFDALPHTSFCVLRKSQARALIGGACLAAGGLVMVVGLAFIAVFALQRTGVAQTIVNFTPVGRATGAISSAARASARPRPRTETPAS